MIKVICDENGKPYAFAPECIECVEDLTSKSDKPTVTVTMKSGKTVVLNVNAAKFITISKQISNHRKMPICLILKAYQIIMEFVI